MSLTDLFNSFDQHSTLIITVAVIVVAVFNYRRNMARLRRIGFTRYRVWAFMTSRNPDVIRAKARQLSDDALLGAYHLPEHSEKAKQVLREELAARGYDDKRLAEWRRPPAQITVPPAVKLAIDPKRYFKIVRTRKRLFRAFRFGTQVVLGALIFAALASVLGIAIVGAALAFLALLLFCILLLLFALASILGRNRAVRILLLRPFGERKMTKPLKRVILGEVGSLGVVFTLADRNYKPNPLLSFVSVFTWIPRVFLSPLLRESMSFASVRNESGFTTVAFRMFSRWWLSRRSFLNGGQAFTIRSTNAWWQTVIDLLMHSCDLTVMDVSRVSEGSTWEIHHLESDTLVRKCIFIVQEEHQQDGLASVAQLFPAGAQPELYVYDKNGVFKEPAEFRAALEGRVVEAVAAWGKPRPADLALGATTSVKGA
jgi:hypothetical protein